MPPLVPSSSTGCKTSWRTSFVPGRMVSYTEAIHFDALSPFRPCGRDLVEFFNSTVWAFPVKLIGDEGKRCAAYRLLFARRFARRALSRRRRAVRERVTNRLAPIATLALPSHKGSFVQRRLGKRIA